MIIEPEVRVVTVNHINLDTTLEIEQGIAARAKE